MKVSVYSTATCAFCHLLRKWLDEKSIQYDVIMVDEDQIKAQELLDKSGQLGVPFTLVQHDDGKEDTVLGFDVAKLQSIFG